MYGTAPLALISAFRRINIFAALSAAIFWLVILCGCATPAFAIPIGERQALDAVRGWLALDSTPLNAPMAATEAGTPLKASRFEGPDGQAAYFVVTLAPSGFVIVAGDDEVEPIVAFSPAGFYSASRDTPLGALVSNDLPGRVVSVRSGAGLSSVQVTAARNARAKWQRLLGQAPWAPLGLSSISDVRVEPLVQSLWDQDVAAGYNVYNLFTPSNYVCGCVATAMAQLMRFHRHPAAGVGTKSFPIWVDSLPATRSLRGGDGHGGPYDWANMALVPFPVSTLAQRQAIGALTADSGVSVNMRYARIGGSSADTLQTARAFRETFGYGNARAAYNSGANLPAPARDAMVNPNLDAGLPILFGITGTPGGHAVVGDGYGYNLGTLYHHLNMGWSGSFNLWYNLPTINSGMAFTSVYKAVYNVFPTGTGEIISGRVTDSDAEPIPGAAVAAVRSGGGTYTATTNAKGIYALANVPSASSYSVSVTKSGYTFDAAKTVFTGTSGDYQPTTGNLWGVDFTGNIAASTGSLTVTLSPAEAVSAGARWRVDNGEWQESGATAFDLAAGQHDVEFLAVAGWTAPGVQSVSVPAGQAATLSAVYTALPTGSLSVTLAPVGAVNAAARWRVDGGPWQESGAILNGLWTGEHIVSFKPVPGWLTPPPQTVAIAEGQDAAMTGTYADASRAYRMLPTAYAWVDDAGATTVATDADEFATQPFPIGFPFRFYGAEYTYVQASSNGFLSFETLDSGSPANAAIPSAQAPDALIAAYWDDLVFRTAYGSRLSWQLTGTAPNRRLVVTWANCKQFDLSDAGGPAISFQAILEETTNRIVLQYKAVEMGDPTYESGKTASVGIEDKDGVNGVQYLYNTALLSASQAISFTPGQAAPGLPLGALMLLLGD